FTSNTASNVLDLTNNSFIINYSGSSPIASIQSMIASGYNAGAWNGGGINSSTAATSPNSAIGYAEATDLFNTFPNTFAGQPIDATSLLMRYTTQGDANLDRTTDSVDFNLLAAHFSETGTSWFTGDFNYDGTTDTIDFNLLAGAFGQSIAAS